jgi:nitrite reductase (NADH) large subunit
LERTYDFVERLGIEKIRKDTIYAPEAAREALRDRFRKSKARSYDAWQEGAAPLHPTQFLTLEPVDKVLR